MVGSRIYGIKRFVRESQRLGINRVIPYNVLKKMKWGDVILLASHSKIPRKTDSPLINADKTTNNEGIATIFGYFRVHSLSDTMPENIKKDFVDSLDIIEVATEPPKTVVRGCGSYMVHSMIYVNNTIEQLVEKIETACEKNGVNVYGCKFFLTGTLELLEQPVILHDRSFFRGYAKVDLPLDIPAQKHSKRAVIFIKDYRNNWSEKQAKDRVDNHIIEEFMEAVH